jgi:hypothetical protein
LTGDWLDPNPVLDPLHDMILFHTVYALLNFKKLFKRLNGLAATPLCTYTLCKKEAVPVGENMNL